MQCSPSHNPQFLDAQVHDVTRNRIAYRGKLLPAITSLRSVVRRTECANWYMNSLLPFKSASFLRKKRSNSKWLNVATSLYHPIAFHVTNIIPVNMRPKVPSSPYNIIKLFK